jgi:hypothetical protein
MATSKPSSTRLACVLDSEKSSRTSGYVAVKPTMMSARYVAARSLGAVTRSRPLGFRAAGSMVRTAPRSVVIAGATLAKSSCPSFVAFTVRVVL